MRVFFSETEKDRLPMCLYMRRDSVWKTVFVRQTGRCVRKDCLNDRLQLDRNSTSNSTLRHIFHFLCAKKREHTQYLQHLLKSMFISFWNVLTSTNEK